MCIQIANSNPLVSDRQDLSVLQREYAEDDTVYQLKIKVSQTAPPAQITAPTSGRISSSVTFQPKPQTKLVSISSVHIHLSTLYAVCVLSLFVFLFLKGPIQKILIHS